MIYIYTCVCVWKNVSGSGMVQSIRNDCFLLSPDIGALLAAYSPCFLSRWREALRTLAHIIRKSSLDVRLNTGTVFGTKPLLPRHLKRVMDSSWPPRYQFGISKDGIWPATARKLHPWQSCPWQKNAKNTLGQSNMAMENPLFSYRPRFLGDFPASHVWFLEGISHNHPSHIPLTIDISNINHSYHSLHPISPPSSRV